MDIDFQKHVAIVGGWSGRQAIVRSGRYIVFEPGRAEMAFVVIDAAERASARSDAPSHQDHDDADCRN
jgi:hypothetical protein